MATSGATVAAAMAAKARRELGEYFERNNAFDPTRAVAYDPPSDMHRTQFDSFIGRGIIKETLGGHYWLDRDVERADEERRRAAAMVMLKIILIAFAIGIAAAAIMSAGY